ncbi:MAG: signal peptidase I [Planctomycetes bacterium]|nr:signal peptidase I [Planctomycetota bacterium]
MPGNERNDYFKHLDQPAAQPPAPRPRTPLPASQKLPEQSDYGSVPDPFGDASGEQPAAPKRPPSRATPGLSPGIPRLRDAEPPPPPPRSGVVLTPSGLRRRDGKPVTAEVPAAPEEPPMEEVSAEEPAEMADQNDLVEPSAEPEQEQDQYAASRAKNENKDDVGWEEYAADEGAFPAVEAEELGVKTKTTDSGRIVPVAIRSDLTPEALKGKSIKGGGKHPRPAKKRKGDEDEGDEGPKAPPKSWMGRIGQSLRMKFFGGKLVVEGEEEQEDEVVEEEPQLESGHLRGFAASGSGAGKPAKKVLRARHSAKRTSGIAKSGSEVDEGAGKGALSIIKTFAVEVVKIVLLVMLLRAYVLQVSEVKGPSMEPTMVQNDRLVVERVTALIENSGSKDDKGNPTGLKYLLPEFLRPRFNRGDMVVVRSPEDPGSELVKRLIALPGDTIKFTDGKLWIKPAGEPHFREYPEPYLDPKHTGEDNGKPISSSATRLPTILRDGKELLVPEDRIFVMGDNRPHSNDSRSWLDIEVGKTEPAGIGKLWLHMRSIEGRVLFRIYPFDRVWPPIK